MLAEGTWNEAIIEFENNKGINLKLVFNFIIFYTNINIKHLNQQISLL